MIVCRCFDHAVLSYVDLCKWQSLAASECEICMLSEENRIDSFNDDENLQIQQIVEVGNSAPYCRCIFIFLNNSRVIPNF